MKTRRWFATMLAAALGCLACSSPEEPVVPEPVLRTVRVEVPSLTLPAGGSAVLPFTVEDKDASVQEVKLFLSGGREPEEFFVRELTPGSEAGNYEALVVDAGTGKEYNREVHLAVVRHTSGGSEYYVQSPLFRIQAEPKPEGPEYTGLPVVYVDTEGGKPIVSKEEFLKATMKIKGNAAYEGLDGIDLEIRGRGNTTWGWPKKPYLLKLGSKQSVFGMPKHKRWILLANFMDRTLMRNLVSMKVSSMTGLAWTPGCVPVELVLNGEHKGSYLLIEQVRVDKNRVNIKEMTPEDNAGDALTGGYLLELDFHYDNPVQWIDPNGHNNQWGNGVPFAVKNPDEDDITTQQKAYIKYYVSRAAEALYGKDFQDPETGWRAYLDEDSFIDYWIVFEVMGNHELGNPGSVYMHKDRGGKLVAGPCWDFDWGVLSYNTSPQARTGLVNGKAIWYERLMEDPAFRSKLKARFEELLPKLETIPSYMDECEALLTESARLNFKLWNPAEDGMINGDERLSFHDAVTRLKTIYQERLTVISKNL
jgi:hypothetical protein